MVMMAFRSLLCDSTFILHKVCEVLVTLYKEVDEVLVGYLHFGGLFHLDWSPF